MYTKVDNSSFSHSQDKNGAPKIYNGSYDITTPLSVAVCHSRLATAPIILRNKFKFEVAMFTHCIDMKGNAKCRNLGITLHILAPLVVGKVFIYCRCQASKLHAVHSSRGMLQGQPHAPPPLKAPLPTEGSGPTI